MGEIRNKKGRNHSEDLEVDGDKIRMDLREIVVWVNLLQDRN